MKNKTKAKNNERKKRCNLKFMLTKNVILVPNETNHLLYF